MGLAVRIIPCLDVDQGRVVKGVRFVELRDAGDPVEVARAYNEQGADELTMLDISASHQDRGTTLRTVEAIAGEAFMPLTVGGGVRSLEDVRLLLMAGADKVSINTAAVQDPELVRQAADRFGSQCIVVAVDARRDRQAAVSCWKVHTHGGRRPVDLDVLDWARQMAAMGAGELLLTSMDRDGTGEGFDLELTRAVSDAVSVPLIASGGVGSLEHLAQGVLEGHASAVLAAGIFHFGHYTVLQAKQHLAARGVEVRL